MPPSIVLNALHNPAVAQEQVAPFRLVEGFFQDDQGQIGSHSLVTRAASSSGGDNNGPLIIALIALASLIGTLIIAGSIFLIRYRRMLRGTSTRTTQCIIPRPPRKPVKSRFLGWFGEKKAHQVDPRYIIHQGEGGIIHCQTPPPADLKSILLEPASDDQEPKEHAEDLEVELPQSPPRYRTPSRASDPTEWSVQAIPQDPDNTLGEMPGNIPIPGRVSLERASSADAPSLTEASINSLVLGRMSTESSTFPTTPLDDGLVLQLTIDSTKKSKAGGGSGLFKSLSTRRPARPIPSSPTPPHSSRCISSSPSSVRMIKAGSLSGLWSHISSSSSSRATADMEEIILDISTRRKSATDKLFGTWRPPSIIITPPTNSTLAHQSPLASGEVSLPNAAYTSPQVETADQHVWQTSTPPRNRHRSSRKTSVQRSIPT